MNIVKIFSCLILALVVNCSFLTTPSMSFWGGQKFETAVKKDFIGKEIKIVPQQNRIHTGFGTFSLGDYYYVKSLNSIFFSHVDVIATIKDIDFDDNQIEVSLEDDRLGAGKITFALSEEQFESTDKSHFIEILNGSLSDEKLKDVIVNIKTKKYHLLSSNHYQEEDSLSILDKSSARENGYEPCGFCFKHYIYMPNYKLEKQLASELSSRIRLYSPVSIDNKTQMELSKLGKKVLSHWPIDLLGYDYTFLLIESPEVNAMSLPGGQVFITTAFYDSLEDALELEAILAHEIAHVERQHGLKTFFRKRNEIATKQALAAIGGAVVGATVSNGNYAATGGAMAVALVAATMIDYANGEYYKDQEREADMFASLYFEQNKLDKKSLKRVFKKLQFSNLGAVSDPDPESYTHPQLKDRFDNIAKDKFLITKGKIHCKKKGFEEVYIEPLLLHKSDEGINFYAYLSSAGFVRKKLKEFENNHSYIKQKVNGKNVRLKYVQPDTVYGEFGAIVKFSYGKNDLNLNSFDFSKINIVTEKEKKSSLNAVFYDFL